MQYTTSILCQHSLIKQAETSEDLYEWKSALENALALAPSACAMGQNGIFSNSITDLNEASGEQGMPPFDVSFLLMYTKLHVMLLIIILSK